MWPSRSSTRSFSPSTPASPMRWYSSTVKRRWVGGAGFAVVAMAGCPVGTLHVLLGVVGGPGEWAAFDVFDAFLFSHLLVPLEYLRLHPLLDRQVMLGRLHVLPDRHH